MGGRVCGLPQLPAGTRVLELGCGDGKTLSAMPRSWETIALDISLPGLRLCTRLLPELNLVRADATALPFRKESFGAIFAYHVAGHLLFEGRQSLARETERVLARGGRLFFRDFGREDMRMGKGREVEEGTFLRGPGITTHYFTESETEELFNRLRPISVETRCWTVRIRGGDLVRSEVNGVFAKL